MHQTTAKEALGGFLLTSCIGTLLHFAYARSGGSILLAPFVPVNESIWEHLKLLFWPTVFYSLFTLCRAGFDPHFLWARCCGLFTGLLATIILYYTYTGVIGRGFLLVDISLFYFSAALTYGLGYALRTRFPSPERWEVWLFSLLILLTGLLLCFWTWDPPHIQLFCDPQTGGYGIARPLRK